MTDLEKALRLIREECKSHSNCIECPLRDCTSYKCCIISGQNPEDWTFKGEVDDDRLFA